MEAMNKNELAEYRVGTAIALESSSQLRVPQQPELLDYLERIAVALESLIPFNPLPVPRPRGGGTDIMPGLSREDRTALKDLKGDLSQVKADLAQIKELLSADRGEVVKEAYTVEEAATRTKYKPFTLRQACNKGRIKGAYKGRDHAWRIPHASFSTSSPMASRPNRVPMSEASTRSIAFLVSSGNRWR